MTLNTKEITLIELQKIIFRFVIELLEADISRFKIDSLTWKTL